MRTTRTIHVPDDTRSTTATAATKILTPAPQRTENEANKSPALPIELMYDKENRRQWLARWANHAITYHVSLAELPVGVRAAAPYCLRTPGAWVQTRRAK